MCLECYRNLSGLLEFLGLGARSLQARMKNELDGGCDVGVLVALMQHVRV